MAANKTKTTMLPQPTEAPPLPLTQVCKFLTSLSPLTMTWLLTCTALLSTFALPPPPTKPERRKLERALAKARHERRFRDVEVLQRVVGDLWPEWFDDLRRNEWVCGLVSVGLALSAVFWPQVNVWAGHVSGWSTKSFATIFLHCNDVLALFLTGERMQNAPLMIAIFLEVVSMIAVMELLRIALEALPARAIMTCSWGYIRAGLRFSWECISFLPVWGELVASILLQDEKDRKMTDREIRELKRAKERDGRGPSAIQRQRATADEELATSMRRLIELCGGHRVEEPSNEPLATTSTTDVSPPETRTSDDEISMTTVRESWASLRHFTASRLAAISQRMEEARANDRLPIATSAIPAPPTPQNEQDHFHRIVSLSAQLAEVRREASDSIKHRLCLPSSLPGEKAVDRAGNAEKAVNEVRQELKVMSQGQEGFNQGPKAFVKDERTQSNDPLEQAHGETPPTQPPPPPPPPPATRTPPPTHKKYTYAYPRPTSFTFSSPTTPPKTPNHHAQTIPPNSSPFTPTPTRQQPHTLFPARLPETETESPTISPRPTPVLGPTHLSPSPSEFSLNSLGTTASEGSEGWLSDDEDGSEDEGEGEGEDDGLLSEGEGDGNGEYEVLQRGGEDEGRAEVNGILL
ncbi:hypothetical protein M409DRAFT_26187 [Zasmidium cellare ATCC 36951]|uniref:Uncharacterized protein n=1 Tax=Zasmidium cellare ATCC 36951 TaxID=1080233 RepID=A0A6A6C8R8_ZASCE|nr:uncharacterized protein M409DRAFT_26187 [Zasmidium cellare ATCC 36951]KAF2163577.1 hypothetical protein M409DRAFT_26187 [Zasmidium cellare ATCC 36951]